MNKELIIFDLDNTLVNFNKCEKAALKITFHHYNLTFNDEIHNYFSKVDRNLWDNKTWNEKYVSVKDIPIKRFEILFERFNFNLKEISDFNEMYMTKFSEMIYPYDESHEIIEYLYNKGYKIAVATNGLNKLQKPRILNTSFGKYFNIIMTSEESGYSKPNPKIFDDIIKELGVNKDNALVIGDSLKHDILGANNTGIESVWFNQRNQFNESDIMPTYIVQNLRDLKKML